MKQPLAKYLNHHAYPSILLRFPQLIRFIHFWNTLVLQRNWLVKGILKSLLPELSEGAAVLDAGCGDGLHIFSPCREFPHIRFTGFDKNEGNIAFCRAYAATRELTNLEFFHQNLEDISLQNSVDLILCTGTLQYIEDDRRVLVNFAKALKVNGKLVIYTPVNGRTILPVYRHFFSKINHYEKSQERRRIYTTEEILDKISDTGMKVEQRRYSYGTSGILAHEIYSLLLPGMGNTGFWAWVFGLLLAVLLPFILVLKVVDYFIPKKDGNGLMLQLGKR